MNDVGKYMPLAVTLIGTCSFLIALSLVNWSSGDLFLTPDQQGRIYMSRKAYRNAARVFQDPLQRGTALYRAGDFKGAAASFGQDDSVEALYNRANALLMLGEYDQAVVGYRRALAGKPGWKEAADNLELALQRKNRLHLPNEGDEGTGGMLAPDKIVFDEQAANATEDQKETVSGGKQRLSDAELSAMWLRRVQTRPADFLRAKFSYQAARQTTGDPEQGGAE
ncbi:MAG: hypothetical protein LJE94_08800 [Deltaproteobacteria bacterium]|jgi:Ca-activated chloride channel family protein|nr:hypothetical protein [Deltaproteobacteria bacterium]